VRVLPRSTDNRNLHSFQHGSHFRRGPLSPSRECGEASPSVHGSQKASLGSRSTTPRIPILSSSSAHGCHDLFKSPPQLPFRLAPPRPRLIDSEILSRQPSKFWLFPGLLPLPLGKTSLFVSWKPTRHVTPFGPPFCYITSFFLFSLLLVPLALVSFFLRPTFYPLFLQETKWASPSTRCSFKTTTPTISPSACRP